MSSAHLGIMDKTEPLEQYFEVTGTEAAKQAFSTFVEWREDIWNCYKQMNGCPEFFVKHAPWGTER